MDNNEPPRQEPDAPGNRKFLGEALLYDGRAIKLSGDALDHITFLIRITARLTEIPVRVKALKIEDVTGRLIIPGLNSPMPRG